MQGGRRQEHGDRQGTRAHLSGRAVVAIAVLACLACSNDDSARADNESDAGGATGAGGVPSSGGSGGGAGTAGTSSSRVTALGFTPFPYDITTAAVDDVYRKISEDADLYAFHMTEGVPWVEALADAEVMGYGVSLRDKWSRQRNEATAHPGHAVYVGVTPLDDSRTRLADYWAAGEHMTLPGLWASYAFDAPEVKTAYLSFCRRAIAYFEPDFFAIGLEVNLLRRNSPESWNAYVSLHRDTYQALKQEEPDLPIFVTVTAVDLLEGWTDSNHAEQVAALGELLPYTDYLGLSFYPYMSAFLANPFPQDAFADLAALAPGKTLAIAESGYPAQTTSLPSFGLTFEGTPMKQDAWVELLLREASERRMPMVVNFVLRDYDALLAAAGVGDAAATWRDTGFYDEAGNARPALTRWKAALAEGRTNP